MSRKDFGLSAAALMERGDVGVGPIAGVGLEEPAVLKACSKCSVEKPATAEFFYRRSMAADGLQRTCKSCHNVSLHNTNTERLEALRRGEAVDGGATYDEIAVVLGMSRQGVQFVERVALRKLYLKAARVFSERL